jgi:tetratricopeptide (TPR) repeat protein
VKGIVTIRLAAASIAVLVACSSSAFAADTLTFADDVAPIIVANCTSCHQPGGSAPFSLLAARDLTSRARQIKAAVSARIMPPWKPEPGHGEFVDARRLTDKEVGVIVRWLDEGGAEGAGEQVAPLPDPNAWQLGPPDLVLTLSEPYTLAADGPDAFRNFVLPVSIPSTRYVRAWQFKPGNARVVHHATMHLDATRSARDLDEQDQQPGYDGLVPFSVRDPEGYFLGWTPGQRPSIARAESAWTLEKDSDLVVMLHMTPTGKPETVRPTVGLYFTGERPTKVPATLRLGRQDLDIPPNISNYTARDSYTLPVDVELHTVYPHAHYLARQVRATASLPDGTSRPLLFISNWDFKWQDVYRYIEPVFLPAGTTVSVEFTFDNSAGNARNPHHPPRRVTFGKRANDEMGDLWMQVVPRALEDLPVLTRSYTAKSRPESIRGIEMVLNAEPDTRVLHDQVALLYLEEGQLENAAAHLAESIRIAPDSATAHGNLGTTRLRQGRPRDAVRHFEQSLILDPSYAVARNNLGVALQQDGRLADAATQYRELLRVDPDDATAHYNLAGVLERMLQGQAAIDHLNEALRLRPNYAAASYLLGTILDSSGHAIEAIQKYRDAAAAAPDSPFPLVRLAWVLATSPDARVRRPGEALMMARRAEALVGAPSVAVSDVLAASLAALGEFDKAVAVAQAALTWALKAGNDQVAGEIRRRLDLYASRKPYVSERH